MTQAHSRVGMLLALHVLLGVYSLSDVASKTASGLPFPSLPWACAYGLVLVFLGVYAIGWQQVIKRMPLSSAYANRAITVVWGIFWGIVLFGEELTAGKVLGAALIICGIVLYVQADRDLARPQAEGACSEGEGNRP